MFSTDRNMKFLANCQHWYVDGTFKSSPPLFTQLFTLHGQKDGNILPLVYGLLPDKDEDTYDHFFGIIQESIPNAHPLTIMTDFELASLNAFRTTFPNVKQKCCFFHFMQSLWRNIQKDKVSYLNIFYILIYILIFAFLQRFYYKSAALILISDFTSNICRLLHLSHLKM